MEKMDLFISWSGPRSRAVAEALKEYLPMIVNAFNPWLSCADIDKGARWVSELSAALATARASIICLTPNNLTAQYILFEAGALSKTVEKTYVCTLLIGMEPSDVSGPLAQFQATKPTKSELLQLLKTLNRALGDSAVKETQLEATFELCWPKLHERLDNLPSDGPAGRPKRPDRELLEELVDTMRSASAQTQDRIAVLRSELAEAVSLVAKQIGRIEGSVGVLQAKTLQQPGLSVSGSQSAPPTTVSANAFAEIARSIEELRRSPATLSSDLQAELANIHTPIPSPATNINGNALAELAKVQGTPTPADKLLQGTFLKARSKKTSEKR